MKKFILIDHSIKGFGGHHYEYAVHVLNAARDRGYEPILAVHRDFSDGGKQQPPWQIIPAFEFGFWDGPARSSGPTRGERFRRRWLLLKLRLKYASPGLLASMFPMYVFELTPREIVTSGESHPRILRRLAFMGLLRYPYVVGRALLTLLRVVVDPIVPYLRRVGERVWQLVKDISYPLRGFRYIAPLRNRAGEAAAQKAFGDGVRRALEQVALDVGDIVFIPTLSERDMLGLLNYFSTCPESGKPSWHLLFRRNLFVGREHEYASQADGIAAIKGCFRTFQERLSGQDVRFYTDTGRLTDQYNRLGITSFQTLPIPINPALQGVSHNGSPAVPIRIVYAGDARKEKGYNYLPRIVDSIQRDPGLRDRVMFEFQSNFAHARPEDGSEELLTRSQLQTLASDRVKLHLQPMDSDTYFKTVFAADVLLILYDPRNYYARSSGILIEALSAGIPVIVPAASWMSELLAEPNYAHCIETRKHGPVLDVLPASSLKWSRNGRRLSETGDSVTCCEPSQNTTSMLRSPPGATHLMVVFDRPSAHGAHVKVQIAQFHRVGQPKAVSPKPKHKGRTRKQRIRLLQTDALVLSAIEACDQCAGMVRLREDTEVISLGLCNPFAPGMVHLDRFELVFLKDDTGTLVPEVVGSVYVDPDDIEERVKAVVRDYPHYRRSALQYREIMKDRHSAGRLLTELVS